MGKHFTVKWTSLYCTLDLLRKIFFWGIAAKDAWNKIGEETRTAINDCHFACEIANISIRTKIKQ